MMAVGRKKIVILVITALISLFFVLHLFFFIFHPTRGIFLGLSRLLIMPAAVVQGVPVPYFCVAKNSQEFAQLFTADSRRELFQRALARCIYNAGVVAVAKELGIADSGDLLLLAQQTEAAVLREERFQQAPQAHLLDLNRRLEESLPFADAARRYSEDVSGGSGGDLGVFYLNDLPSWLIPAARLEDGEISQILAGVDAYWLISPVERGGDGDEAWVRLRGIAAKKVTLREVLDDRAALNPPWVFVW